MKNLLDFLSSIAVVLIAANLLAHVISESSRTDEMTRRIATLEAKVSTLEKVKP